MDLDIFFDYLCPFCVRAHFWIVDVLCDWPDLQIRWCACEAHPRSEDSAGVQRHSDRAIMGMHYILAVGGDVLSYHDRVYEAVFSAGLDIEDTQVLASCAEGLVPDIGGFIAALEQGLYAAKVQAANDYAYNVCGVQAVPSYRMGDRRLDSVLGVGVSAEEIRRFISDK